MNETHDRRAEQRKQRVLKSTVIIIAIVIIASVVLALGLSGCSPKPTTEGVRVVATTTQLTDFSSAVVGDTGTVTGLVGPNQSAHSFDPSADQLVALSNAQLLVTNGLGLEPWLDRAIDASGFHGVIVDASTDVTQLPSADPHIWTNPLNAGYMVDNIQAGLDQVAPAQKDTFAANADAYRSQLQSLDTWIRENMAQVPEAQRLLVTNHDALAYFVAEYGITFLGSIIPSMDDNAEPSAADIDALIAEIKRSGATAVFSETSLSPALAQTIAAEAGVAVFDGEDALYADSLGPAGSSGATYLSASIHNVDVLMRAWGYQPLPLPEDLP